MSQRLPGVRQGSILISMFALRLFILGRSRMRKRAWAISDGRPYRGSSAGAVNLTYNALCADVRHGRSERIVGNPL